MRMAPVEARPTLVEDQDTISGDITLTFASVTDSANFLAYNGNRPETGAMRGLVANGGAL